MAESGPIGNRWSGDTPIDGDATRRKHHAIDTKDNFEFERQIEFSRSNSLLDMRRKG